MKLKKLKQKMEKTRKEENKNKKSYNIIYLIYRLIFLFCNFILSFCKKIKSKLKPRIEKKEKITIMERIINFFERHKKSLTFFRNEFFVSILSFLVSILISSILFPFINSFYGSSLILKSFSFIGLFYSIYIFIFSIILFYLKKSTSKEFLFSLFFLLSSLWFYFFLFFRVFYFKPSSFYITTLSLYLFIIFSLIFFYLFYLFFFKLDPFYLLFRKKVKGTKDLSLLTVTFSLFVYYSLIFAIIYYIFPLIRVFFINIFINIFLPLLSSLPLLFIVFIFFIVFAFTFLIKGYGAIFFYAIFSVFHLIYHIISYFSNKKLSISDLFREYIGLFFSYLLLLFLLFIAFLSSFWFFSTPGYFFDASSKLTNPTESFNNPFDFSNNSYILISDFPNDFSNCNLDNISNSSCTIVTVENFKDSNAWYFIFSSMFFDIPANMYVTGFFRFLQIVIYIIMSFFNLIFLGSVISIISKNLNLGKEDEDKEEQKRNKKS